MMHYRTRRTLRTVGLILLLLALLAVVGFVLFRLFAPAGRQDGTPEGTVQTTDTPGGSEAPLPEGSVDSGSMHSFGGLRLFYDDGELACSEEDGRITLLPRGESELPRIDALQLDSRTLDEDQYMRLAAGLLQAYYVDPPATEDVAVTPDPALALCFSLEAPAVGETPAMAARVRFLTADGTLWGVVLLYAADGGSPETLTAAFESAALT